MIAYALFHKEVQSHWRNARCQEYYRNFHYSTDPDKLAVELRWTVGNMVEPGFRYIDRGVYTSTPAHVTPLYLAAKNVCSDEKVDDREVLKRILQLLDPRKEPEDLELLRNTVCNISSKQVCSHDYAWHYKKDQRTLAAALECGLYVALFARLRRKPPTKPPF